MLVNNKTELKVGQWIIADSMMRDSYAGAIRQIIGLTKTGVTLDRPAPFQKTCSYKKKNIVGVFDTEEQCKVIVNVDRGLFEKLERMKKENKDAILQLCAQ